MTELPPSQEAENKGFPGLKAFYKHVLDTATERTNKQLDQENMLDFKFYNRNRERYYDEYQYALKILEKNIHIVLKNNVLDLISALKE